MLFMTFFLTSLVSVVFASYSYSNEWDIFTFTQEWPVSVCIKGKEEHHSCAIPPDVHGWGIHGLWPTKFGTEGPTSCNSSWPFEINAIQDILPQLKIEWPNMYSDTTVSSFWEHEWTKHGTCATSLSATSDQHKYFAKALEMKQRFDGTKLFSNLGIVPDNTATYNITAVEEQLKRELSVNALVMCSYDEKTKHQLMYELEICLNKDFNPVDCYPDEDSNNSGKRSYHHKYPHKPSSNCPKTRALYYPPIPGTYNYSKNGFKRDSTLFFKNLAGYLKAYRKNKDINVSYQ